MARYKPIHQGMKLLAVDFDRQILPGTFEYALRYLVDKELDLDGFHQRYKNDVQGAAAFDPAALLKIILLAYSRGIISSRNMEAACRDKYAVHFLNREYDKASIYNFYTKTQYMDYFCSIDLNLSFTSKCN